MDAHVRDGLVSGYTALIPTLTLPDPHDRHVVAAAIHAKADGIVPGNLRDFPAQTLALFGIEAHHPDEFVTALLAREVARVCEAVKRPRATLHHPSKTAAELLQACERCGLVQTAIRLSAFVPGIVEESVPRSRHSPQAPVLIERGLIGIAPAVIRNHLVQQCAHLQDIRGIVDRDRASHRVNDARERLTGLARAARCTAPVCLRWASACATSPCAAPHERRDLSRPDYHAIY